jgi:hypothetical protein
MGSPIKICFVMLALVAQLFFFGYVAAKPLEGDNPSGQEIRLPATASDRHTLTLVSFSPLVVEGKIVGTVAEYHDSTTKRPVDYWELYNSEGGLAAIGWFDRFGIERMAVDRGILDGKDELEGVFVSLLEGDSI